MPVMVSMVLRFIFSSLWRFRRFPAVADKVDDHSVTFLGRA